MPGCPNLLLNEPEKFGLAFHAMTSSPGSVKRPLAVLVSLSDFPTAKAPRFNFRFTVNGGGFLRVVTDATTLDDPCDTYTTDLSGLVENNIGWISSTNRRAGFGDVEVDTALM